MFKTLTINPETYLMPAFPLPEPCNIPEYPDAANQEITELRQRVWDLEVIKEANYQIRMDQDAEIKRLRKDVEGLTELVMDDADEARDPATEEARMRMHGAGGTGFGDF